MKYLILLFFLGFAQAQDTVTVVAVGEAEVEKDLISVVLKRSDDLTAAEIVSLKQLEEVLKSDFDFYRNLFEVDKESYDSAKKAKGRYVIFLEAKKDKSTVKLSISLRDKTQDKELFKSEKNFPNRFVRRFSHQIADDLYRVITGKESIFMTKIYFIADKGSNLNKVQKDIYVMDFDGANKKRLTYLRSMVISPALSFDNKRLLYSVIETGLKKASSGKGMQRVKNINLHLLNLDTMKSRMVSNVDGINSGAIFNKSGDSIYLTLSYLKNADIYKLNLKTGKKRRITSHFSDDVDPHINGDESQLTFLSGRPGKAMIYTLDPSGVEKKVKRIGFVGRFNAAPRFNPQGSEIVFSSWVDERFDIYRIDNDGRNLVRLTKDFGSNEEPWFSPDGEFIVFTSQRVISRKKAVQDIYIMNREGEIIRKITDGFGKVYTPRWSN